MRILTVLALLLVGACEDDSLSCCVDGASFAVVEASVLDAESSPLPGAGLRGVGHLAPCNPGTDGAALSGQVVTDGSGWARIGLQADLQPPGLYCVDLIVTAPGAVAGDTVSGFEIMFYDGTPPDTSRVVVATGIPASPA
jgi:hypothetical protein